MNASALEYVWKSTVLVTKSNVSKLPKKLLPTIARELMGFVHPDDFEMYAEEFSEFVDEPVTFTHESFGPDDLHHPMIPMMLDPDAEVLTYAHFTHPENADLHLVIARGGNPMGFVLDDAGSMVVEIYDNVFREPGANTYQMSPLGSALYGLWRYGAEGASALDTKDRYFEEERDAALIAFGETAAPPKPPTPIVLYRLADLPQELVGDIPDGDIHDCVFWIVHKGDAISGIFDIPEPDIDSIDEGLQLAGSVLLLASCTKDLAQLLRPKAVPAGGALYGGSYNVGFHTQPGAKTEAWFNENNFTISPLSSIFESLYLLRVSDANGTVSNLQYESYTINKGFKRDRSEAAPGLYAFDSTDSANDHFALYLGDKTIELKGEELTPGFVHEVSFP